MWYIWLSYLPLTPQNSPRWFKYYILIICIQYIKQELTYQTIHIYYIVDIDWSIYRGIKPNWANQKWGLHPTTNGCVSCDETSCCVSFSCFNSLSDCIEAEAQVKKHRSGFSYIHDYSNFGFLPLGESLNEWGFSEVSPQPIILEQ